MARLYTIEDRPSAGLAGERVVLAGFGNQARAHAANLRDSGANLALALRESGESAARARGEGYEVLGLEEGAAEADLFVLLIPDESQPDFYRSLESRLKPGTALGFAHGFAIGFGLIEVRKDLDCFLVAPKAQGLKVRELFEEGKGAAALISVHQDASGRAMERALSYADAIGCLRSAAFETTFREEAVSDLFGEQAVLCGGMSELIRASFDTLVDAGYSPEIAYFETLHEMKILADLIYRKGIDGMRRHISGTALYGDLSRGRRVIDEGTRKRLRDMLKEIESGEFAREWMDEHRSGRPLIGKRMDEDAQHEIESAGKKVRSLMPWLEEKE